MPVCCCCAPVLCVVVCLVLLQQLVAQRITARGYVFAYLFFCDVFNYQYCHIPGVFCLFIFLLVFKCVLNFEFEFPFAGQFLCYTRDYNCEGVRVCIHIFLR